MTPLSYLALGWHLLPISTGTKVPLDGQGLKHATLDEDVVERWCTKGCDWAVACAPSGFIVIDVDPRNGGDVTWQDLCARLGPLPEHPIQQTRNKGHHHCFADPGACIGKLAAGVDVKRRGYILVAPSPGYEWVVPPTGKLPELPPAWLAVVLKSSASPPRSAAPRRQLSDPTSAGTRYGVAALDSECTAVINEPEGGRNNRLNVAAMKISALVAGGELDSGTARERLVEAGLAAGLRENEVRATVGSGWIAGASAPRAAPAPALKLVPREEPPPPTDEDCPSDMLPYTRVSRGEIPGPDDWRQGLTRTVMANGSEVIEKTAGNLALLLSHEPGWAGCLRWDELAYGISWIAAPPPIPGLATPAGRLLDEHHTWVQQAARREWGVKWSKVSVIDAVAVAAMANPHHPVKAYFDTLEWDGKARLSTWLQDYIGGEDPGAIGRWWLISAVARVMRPGCQVDHVLVLQGPQGAGKSSALRILGGTWYSGSLGDLRDKDGAQTLLGAWIVEIGELDAVKGLTATRTKDFISQVIDRYRPSYGKVVVERPRQCVFAGTTNEREYLSDTTGARRFWPVSCGWLRRSELHEARDQLWAEAVAAYEDGERWWPEGQEEAAVLSALTEDRFVTDPWEDALRFWLGDQAGMSNEVSMGEVLASVGVEKGRWTYKESRRAGAIMRRCGWERYWTRQGRRWRPVVSE